MIPNMSFNQTSIPISTKAIKKQIHKFADKMVLLQTTLVENIRLEQTRIEGQVNKSRKPPPAYQLGDQV